MSNYRLSIETTDRLRNCQKMQCIYGDYYAYEV